MVKYAQKVRYWLLSARLLRRPKSVLGLIQRAHIIIHQARSLISPHTQTCTARDQASLFTTASISAYQRGPSFFSSLEVCSRFKLKNAALSDPRAALAAPLFKSYATQAELSRLTNLDIEQSNDSASGIIPKEYSVRRMEATTSASSRAFPTYGLLPQWS